MPLLVLFFWQTYGEVEALMPPPHPPYMCVIPHPRSNHRADTDREDVYLYPPRGIGGVRVRQFVEDVYPTYSAWVTL